MLIIQRLNKNFVLKFILSELFIPYFINAEDGAVFSYFILLLGLSQYRESVDTINNRSFKAQSKVSFFTNLNANNSTLTNGSLLFLNRIT